MTCDRTLNDYYLAFAFILGGNFYDIGFRGFVLDAIIAYKQCFLLTDHQDWAYVADHWALVVEVNSRHGEALDSSVFDWRYIVVVFLV